MSLLAGRIATLGTENAFKLGADIQRCVERGMEVIKFNLGEPDFDSAAHINREAIAQIEAGNSHYCDPAGLLGLRETIARHVSATREIEVDPGRVVVTTGGKPPIGYTFQTYVDPGDEIIYPSPGFPIYESWVTFVGAVPVPLQLSEDSGFGFTADELAALITERTKLIILCSPSNPTGGGSRITAAISPRSFPATTAVAPRSESTPTRSTSTFCSMARPTTASSPIPRCQSGPSW